MNPYYQKDGQTIYNGDSLEIMRGFPEKSFDLVLTDPPYGIGAAGDNFQNGNKRGKNIVQDGKWDESAPSREFFSEIFRVSKNQVIWGGNYFVDYLKPSRCFLVWDKTVHGNSYADCEMAFTSLDANARIKRLPLNAIHLEGRSHPTQKPLELMKWCLGFFPEAQSILDPFGGSGTTAVAAKYLNRNCTLIEISEKYCEIAKNRLAQGRLF